LTETAAVLAELMRESDFVARLGGDEFVILLPDTRADAARVSLERSHSDDVLRMPRYEWPLRATISPVAYARPPAAHAYAEPDVASLMDRAKANGKNWVLVVAVDGGSERLPAPGAPEPPDHTGRFIGRTRRRASR